jgi:RNA polymerase II subunit A small phosphatase-like protein
MRKPLLILDVDETLVHSTTAPLPVAHDVRAGPFYVHARPHLNDFLEQVRVAYQLAVWTSAARNYAETVARELLPADLKLAFLWCRERCTLRFDPEYQVHVWMKDLKKVKRKGHPLSRILIVDDRPIVVSRNYGNHVPVTPYRADPSDTELRDLAPYLLSLANRRDFRRIEKRGWRSKRPPAAPADRDTHGKE